MARIMEKVIKMVNYVEIKSIKNNKLIGYVAQDEQGNQFLKPVNDKLLKGISGTQYLKRTASKQENTITDNAEYVDTFDPYWIIALSETTEEPNYDISSVKQIENMDDLPMGE